jgi:hypothetical protein
MPTPLLTSASQLLCPHGGQVQPLPGGVRALASGQPILRVSDGTLVLGCPAAKPCQQVQFISGSQRVMTSGGTPLATADGVAQCLAADGSPQGPVLVAAGQARALAG